MLLYSLASLRRKKVNNVILVPAHQTLKSEVYNKLFEWIKNQEEGAKVVIFLGCYAKSELDSFQKMYSRSAVSLSGIKVYADDEDLGLTGSISSSCSDSDKVVVALCGDGNLGEEGLQKILPKNINHETISLT